MLNRLKYYFIIFVALSLSIANAQNHINPEELVDDDEFTYKYFNDIIKEFADVLNEMVFDNPDYFNDSIYVFKKVEKTRTVILIYKSKNIESPSEYIINPFYEFSKELMHLCELNKELKDDLAKNTTYSLYNARLRIVEINETINNMETLLDEIDNISILKKGNETLKFNTSDVRKYLELYKKKFSKYGNITITNLTIDVSNKNPILFENITIYGIGENGYVIIHINNEENKTYNLTVKNNLFLMKYSFNRTGIYKIYATQNGKTSNIVYVNVSRIPSYMVVDNNYTAYVGEEIKINGKLIDYYGNPIKNTTIFANNKIIHVDDNGTFTIVEFSPKSLLKLINLVYKGNEIYKPANKTVDVEFLKYPVKITIYTDKTNVSVNEPLIIYGNVEGLNRTSDVCIFVNDNLYKIIKTNGTFKTNIFFNSSGDYVVYAIYRGDEYHEGCKSNIIKIHVKENSPIIFIILGIVALGLIIGYLYKNKVFKQSKYDKEKIVVEVSEENIVETKEVNEKDEEIPNDIKEAYKFIFNKITSKYNLPKNLTPRELLNIIKEKKPDLYDDLNIITKIHENYVYKGIEINAHLREEFFKRINKILGEINE
ncbi:hypothetical protein ACO3TA_07615 [Methanocaldococcus sp. 28A]